LSGWWDDGFGFSCLDGVENGVIVIGAIGEYGLGFDPVDQTECSWRILSIVSHHQDNQKI